MRMHPLCAMFLVAAMAASTWAAEVFVRFKVVEPAGEKFRVTVGGHIHLDPWSLPHKTLAVAGGQWSEWVDLTKWPLHKRLDREGGLA